ncbi:unnamed protein product [Lactuca saligna]|uniref:Uncharacterized protein n=1 Tax=Lactuca saligna TaxID=75948 RepID=A0AA36EBX4_LACSI|nr:unnamed protein product [Lactuca saligna]
MAKEGTINIIEQAKDYLDHLKHIKPQYETWTASKITVVKVTGPIETDNFPNAKLKVARGSFSQVYEFILANLPCLNPYDWIVLYNFLLRYGQKYEPVIAHLKQMIISYIYEVGQMDAEIVVVLIRKPSVLPKDNPDGFDKMKLGKIQKNRWCVAFQLKG